MSCGGGGGVLPSPSLIQHQGALHRDAPHSSHVITGETMHTGRDKRGVTLLQPWLSTGSQSTSWKHLACSPSRNAARLPKALACKLALSWDGGVKRHGQQQSVCPLEDPKINMRDPSKPMLSATSEILKSESSWFVIQGLVSYAVIFLFHLILKASYVVILL